MRCPRCGHENQAGRKNCYQCGLALKTVKAENPNPPGSGLAQFGKQWTVTFLLLVALAVSATCLYLVFR